MTLSSRYEIRELLGQGGMGIVYRAYDRRVKRDVAVKTLRDKPEPEALQLFQRECDVLASISHPNIVEIFDIGEFQDGADLKPYFVMPLLRGATLDKIRTRFGDRLTLERRLDIVGQTCRGLQAAHERGLIHRDLKPSNIFVMDDDSVKVIDFGIAHMLEARSTFGLKGTLYYMSPEQVEMRPLSPASDVFSVAVVAYELLTGQLPFQGATEADIAQTIVHGAPAAVHDLNPAVNRTVSRVIHKALAKQPHHRIESARELAENLRKAARGEVVEFVAPGRVQPRLERASKAFEHGDYEFALEILTGLESEGFVDTAIRSLRQQVELAARTKRLDALLESARGRLAQEEFVLALEKAREALRLAPDDAGAAALEREILQRLEQHKIDAWLRTAREHIQHGSYSAAREVVDHVLRSHPADARALELLDECNRLEQEWLRACEQRERIFRDAERLYERGDLDSALRTLQEARIPVPSRTTATADDLYIRIFRDRDELEAACRDAYAALAAAAIDEAVAICNRYLRRYPNDARLKALAQAIQERNERLTAAERDARIVQDYLRRARQLQSAGDLQCALALLDEATAAYPNDERLQGMRQILLAQHQSMSRPLEVDDADAPVVIRRSAAEFLRDAADRLLAWERVISERRKMAGVLVAMSCAVVLLIATLRKPASRPITAPPPAPTPVQAQRKSPISPAPEPATPAPDAVQPTRPRPRDPRPGEDGRTRESAAPRVHSLEITTEPAGARVDIHGEHSESSCTSPCPAVELAAGRYGIQAELPGYRTKIRIIHVPEIRELHLSLDQKQGFVAVRSEVAEAPIIIDGKESGRRTSAGAPEKLPLAPGKHVISIPGGAPQTIEVRDGQLITVIASK